MPERIGDLRGIGGPENPAVFNPLADHVGELAE